MGNTLYPRKIIALRSIEYKYREGKLKSTLRRELDAPEIDKVEVHKITLSSSVSPHAYCTTCLGMYAVIQTEIYFIVC